VAEKKTKQLLRVKDLVAATGFNASSLKRTVYLPGVIVLQSTNQKFNLGPDGLAGLEPILGN
jgi:hypothetical protein